MVFALMIIVGGVYLYVHRLVMFRAHRGPADADTGGGGGYGAVGSPTANLTPYPSTAIPAQTVRANSNGVRDAAAGERYGNFNLI